MKKILVVDDEQNIRFLYKEELEDDGYHVSVAATGEEALQKLDNQDLIILAIKIPGMMPAMSSWAKASLPVSWGMMIPSS